MEVDADEGHLTAAVDMAATFRAAAPVRSQLAVAATNEGGAASPALLAPSMTPSLMLLFVLAAVLLWRSRRARQLVESCVACVARGLVRLGVGSASRFAEGGSGSGGGGGAPRPIPHAHSSRSLAGRVHRAVHGLHRSLLWQRSHAEAVSLLASSSSSAAGGQAHRRDALEAWGRGGQANGQRLFDKHRLQFQQAWPVDEGEEDEWALQALTPTAEPTDDDDADDDAEAAGSWQPPPYAANGSTAAMAAYNRSMQTTRGDAREARLASRRPPPECHPFGASVEDTLPHMTPLAKGAKAEEVPHTRNSSGAHQCRSQPSSEVEELLLPLGAAEVAGGRVGGGSVDVDEAVNAQRIANCRWDVEAEARLFAQFA